MITNLTVLIVSGCVWVKSLCCTPYRFRSVQSLSCVRLSTTPWAVAARPPCPSLTTRTCSNSCPFSQWCHPTISSSVTHFSSRLQSSPASRSSPVSQLFASGGQSTGVSASASVPPMNIQDRFPLGLTGWSLQGTVKSLLQHRSSKASILLRSAFFTVQLSHPHMTTGKTISFTRQTFLAM